MRMLLALAVAAVAIAAGCSSPKGAGAANVGRPRVVFIPKNAGNPYFNQLEKGLQAAGRGLGLSIETQAPAVAEATSQLSVIKDAVQRGARMIVISANSPDALNEALGQARAKGVTIVTVDSDLTGHESMRDAAILPTDFSTIGPAQLELLASQMDYHGDFAILSATTDAPNQNAWIEGIKKALRDSRYRQMRLVEIVYGDDEPQKSATETEGLLSKHSELRGILSPTSVGLAAAAQVLETAGVYPGGPKAAGAGIVLTGLSTPSQMRRAVEKGVVAKFQLWDPADMGVIAAYVASGLGNGKLKLEEGMALEVPGHGSVRVGPNNIIYAGPLLTFDRENVGSFEF